MIRILVTALALTLPLAPSSRADTVTVQGSMTINPLDVAIVTTGGVAVTALNAGHRARGGWLYNPIGATTNLCINEVGIANGTVSAGNLTCIVPGQIYQMVPSIGPVSVVSSDSAHAFSGLGYQ